MGSLLALFLAQCTGGGCRGTTQVVFFRIDGEEVSAADRRVIEGIARAAVDEVRRYLPQLPTPVVVRVQPGSGVIPETGETGTTAQPNRVLWMVDIHRPGGAQLVATTWLRACLFHELHHLAREAASPRVTLLDTVVAEGLATVFERDVAQVETPWGEYPEEVDAWVDELRRLPPDTPRRAWISRHPDGRRWVAHKAGTYLAERAIRASGKSAAELVTTSTEEILRLATQR